MIQFLLLLKQTLESRFREIPLIFNGNFVNLESFRNTVYGKTVSNCIELTMDLTSLESYFNIKFNNSLDLLYVNKFEISERRPISRRLHATLETSYLRRRAVPLISDQEPFKYTVKFQKKKNRYDVKSTNKYHNLILNLVYDDKHNKENQLRRFVSAFKKFNRYYFRYIFYRLRESISPKLLELYPELKKINFHMFKSSDFRKVVEVISDLSNNEIAKIVESIKERFSHPSYSFKFFLPRIYQPSEQKNIKVKKTTKFDKVDLWLSIITTSLDYVIEDFNFKVNQLETVLVLSLNKMFIIGPLREDPRRIYIAPEYVSTDVGQRGEYAVQIYSRMTDDQKRQVQKWLQKLELAKEVKAEKVAGRTLRELVLKEFNSNLDVNIADIGFGVSQIFPLIVQTIASINNSIIISEQPEIHLNPKVQLELAEFFVEFHKDKKFIIETHSEHIINRLQRKVAQGKLKPENIGIFYFSIDEEGTKVQEIEIGEEGLLENWPSRFFEDFAIERLKYAEDIYKRKK